MIPKDEGHLVLELASMILVKKLRKMEKLPSLLNNLAEMDMHEERVDQCRDVDEDDEGKKD